MCGFCFFCVYLCLIFGRDCANVLHEHNFSRDVWSAGEVASDSDHPSVYVHTVFPAMLPEGKKKCLLSWQQRGSHIGKGAVQ